MALTVVINNLTLVHKGSSGVAICGPPDICHTPLAGSSAALPYLNVALSKDLIDGAATVVADGGNPAANTASAFYPSAGDEPGSLGGIISGVNMGKAQFTTFSPDVVIEGKPACRLSDAMSMNGNAPNTSTPAEIQANASTYGGPGSVFCNAFCFCNKKTASGDFRKGEDFIEKVKKGDLA